MGILRGPATAVLYFLATCNGDRPDLARSVLAPVVVDWLDRTAGWRQWWAETRPPLVGLDLDNEWRVVEGALSAHDALEPGYRVMLARNSDMGLAPGGVTADGGLYEVTTTEGLVADSHAFWVIETPGGWRIRAFGTRD
jgi:hypothetical protein